MAITEKGAKSGEFRWMSGAALDATDATSNFSESFPCAGYIEGAIQIVWTGISSGAATVQTQTSVDGTNFDNYGAPQATSGTAGSATLQLAALPGQFVRLSVTAAGGAGTVTPHVLVKR